MASRASPIEPGQLSTFSGTQSMLADIDLGIAKANIERPNSFANT